MRFKGAHLVHRIIKTHVILVLVTSGSLLAPVKNLYVCEVFCCKGAH